LGFIGGLKDLNHDILIPSLAYMYISFWLVDAMEERKYVETGSDRILLLSQFEDRN